MEDNFTIDNVADVFIKYKEIIFNSLIQNLRAHDKDQPGRLIQSIDVDVEVQGTKVTFELKMEDYWKYVDEGVRGTQANGNKSQYAYKQKAPPAKAILDFIKVRGIKPKLTKRREKKIKDIKNKQVKKAFKQITMEARRKQLAFGIATKIKKFGIKPTHFYSDVINEELYLKMKTDIAIALGKDIEINFKTLN